MNTVVLGNAVDVCEALPKEKLFDLVYLDPPYGVGTTMTARLEPGQSRGSKTTKSGPAAYEDKDDTDDLIRMLHPSLASIRGRMAKNATLYLHLDHRAVHEVKVLCDQIFGRGAYLGEIIWTPGNGGRGSKHFSVTHQTILIYARNPKERKDVTYNASDPCLREPYAKISLAMHFKQKDEAGRAYRERTIGKKTYRYYADEGRRRGSVWTDLPAMSANTPLQSESTGYPTQKPEKLLERIIRASSHEGQVVADLMCGSGTTGVVAARLGRKFFIGDRSEMAVDLTEKRLQTQEIVYERIPVKT